MKCYICNSDEISASGKIFYCRKCGFIQKKCSNGHLVPIESNFCNLCGTDFSETVNNRSFVSNFNTETKSTQKILCEINDIFINVKTFFINFSSYIVLINPTGNYFVFNKKDNSSFQGKFELSGEIIKVEYSNFSIFILTGNTLFKTDWNNFLLNKNELIKLNNSTKDFLFLKSKNMIIILTSQSLISLTGDSQSIELSDYSKIFSNEKFIFCFKQDKNSVAKLSILNINNPWKFELSDVPLQGQADEKISIENLLFASSEREITFSFKAQTLFMANIRRLIHNFLSLRREKQPNITALLFTENKMISESDQNIQIWSNFGREFLINGSTLLPASIIKSIDEKIICFPTEIDDNSYFIFYDENGNYQTRLLIQSKRFKYLFDTNNNIIILDFQKKHLSAIIFNDYKG